MVKKSKFIKKMEALNRQQLAAGWLTKIKGWGEGFDDVNSIPALVVKTEAEIEEERLEEERRAISASLSGWPWGNTIPKNLVTLAPFVFNSVHNTEPFSKAEASQDSAPIFKILNNDLIRVKITKLLFMRHDSASNFAATSRLAWRYITLETHAWDPNRGFFEGCEQQTSANASVKPVVIVSPIRGPKDLLSVARGDQARSETSEDLCLYKCQLTNLHKMCKFRSH